MEKNLSLNHEETTALLEMSLFTYLNETGEAADSALIKLGDLWREFWAENHHEEETDVARKLARVA